MFTCPSTSSNFVTFGLKTADIMPKESSYDIVILAYEPNSIGQCQANTCLVGEIRCAIPFAWHDLYSKLLGSHYGITRILVAGLRQLEAPFTYSLPLNSTTARIATVLSGVADSKSAIGWR
jgi:hypothetical protein